MNQEKHVAGRVEGKVALITGAARGQGRSHAVRLAEEGADIIAIDSCVTPKWCNYPLADDKDLQTTVELVEATGRRIVAVKADVTDKRELTAAVDESVAQLGRLDVVVANAGVGVLGHDEPSTVYTEVASVNISGVLNTIHAALGHLREGASVIAIGSFAGMRPQGVSSGPGGSGYSFSKRSVSQLVHSLAVELGPRFIRVNAVHPSNCDTNLLQNESMYKVFRPDLDKPTREDALDAFASMQLMPVPWVEPQDVSHMVLFLASEESRYVTGMQMRVDAGALIKAGVSGL